MTRFQLLLAFALTLVITIAAGAVHGRLSGRWGGGSVAQEAAQSLQATPEQFGQWRLEKQDPLGEVRIRPTGTVRLSEPHLCPPEYRSRRFPSLCCWVP